MKICQNTITIVRGDSGGLRLKINGHTLSNLDTIKMTVRNKNTNSVLFSKIAEKISDTEAYIGIKPEDTKNAPYGNYIYDLECDFNGNIQTVLTCESFIIDCEVTK